MGDNDRRTLLDEAVLSYLRRSGRGRLASVTRKTIQRQLNSNVMICNTSSVQINEDNTNYTEWSKRDVKDALKRLVKRGDIVKNGKEYSCSSRAGDDPGDDVPIAQRMRRPLANPPRFMENNVKCDETNNKLDLDEEIRRLEEELAKESEEDEDYDEVDESDNEVEDCDVHSENNSASNDIIDDSYSNGIIHLSDLAHDRIEPLPQSALPQSKRRHLKGVDAAANHDDQPINASRKKRKQSQREQGEHSVSEGLRHAVQDLLQNYIRPSQLDRPPFYCRICQHQSTSQSEFDLHRASEFHKVAVKEEQKKTYCKLCRKQLTSVIQMEEHLTSKPHRDRMDFVKGKQRGMIRNPVGGTGNDGGMGVVTINAGQKQRGFTKRDGSGRQWC